MAENISKIILNGTEYVIKDAATQYHTINGQQITGGTGDITITGGGGSTYSAGTNIDITNGIISCTLNASNGRGDYSFKEGWGTFANNRCAHAEGEQTFAGGLYSHAEGYLTSANGDYSHTEGYQTKANNKYEHSSGQYNVSNTGSTTFGNGGNTLFSVGNGTSNSARHNAFEIRQNGDIYITKDGQDVKLQDQLGGGGGSSYTAGDGIDITNDVISVTGKVDTSTYSTYTAATDTALASKADTATTYTKTEVDTALASKQTTLTAGTGISIVDNVISAIGGSGLKKWEGTRAEYNALSSYDADTLYIITDEDVEIPTVPTKVSAFENDAGYLTQHQDISNLATKTELNNKQDKGDYALKTEIPTVPTKVSAFENDAGYALKSNSEEITFTLEDGSTVTKKFVLG